MQYGANTFIWASPFATAEHLPLLEKVRSMGFELLEIAVEAPELVDVTALKAGLEAAGLAAIVCGAFGPERNLSSADAVVRQNAVDYLQWCIDCAAALGAPPARWPLVTGPMYSAVGKPRLATEAERRLEWQRAVDGLREMSAYAAERGVRLAFEPLNRFETDMVNVVSQGLALIEAVDSPHLGLHLDTFHMHLEEKDSGAAIREAGQRLFHFHACENDRGVPGSGQVRWQGVAAALKEVGYDGAVVIESFTPQVASIARAVCIWREIAPSQDAIAQDGLAFLRALLDGEARDETRKKKE